MVNDWDKIQQVLYPIKDYEDLCRRLRVSFSFSFVQDTCNFPMPELAVYTRRLLEEDERGRYNEYAASLIQTMTVLQKQGVKDILDLIARTKTPEHLEKQAEECRIQAHDPRSVKVPGVLGHPG